MTRFLLNMKLGLSLLFHFSPCIIILMQLVGPLEGLECYSCYYHAGFSEGEQGNTKACLHPGPEFLEQVSSEPDGGSGGVTFYSYCQTEESIQDGFRFVQRTNSWFATDDHNDYCLKDLPGREGSLCYCNTDRCNGRPVKDQKDKKQKKDKSQQTNSKKKPNTEL